jgi:hypothetical protein
VKSILRAALAEAAEAASRSACSSPNSEFFREASLRTAAANATPISSASRSARIG